MAEETSTRTFTANEHHPPSASLQPGPAPSVEFTAPQASAFRQQPVSVAEDYTKNHSHSPEDNHIPAEEAPDHGTFYYKSFWGAYKGHVRGMLRGLLLGAIMGGIVGLGVFALLSVAPVVAWMGPAVAAAISTPGMFAGIMAGFVGVGSIIGSELMGKIGNTAGNAAAQFAETEMRLRYPSLPEISPYSPAPGFGHHFEVPPDKDYNRIFHWRVALPGLLVGTGIGLLLANSHAGSHLISEAGQQLISQTMDTAGHVGGHAVEHLAGHAAEHGAEIAAHTATAASHGGSAAALTAVKGAVIGAGSLFGASFGINRGLFKSLFNYSDNLVLGRVTGPSKEAIERDKERYKEQDPANPYPLTGAQRYDEFQRLLNGYYKKAFSAGWSGDRRGFLGGILAGTLSGMAAGLLIASVLTFTPFAVLAPVVIAITTALGGRLGMHIFSDAGREPAAFSAAREIFAERIKCLKHGRDITFDEAEDLARQRITHHPDMDPPGTERQKHWFNWQRGMVGLAAGGLIGAALTPLAIGPVLHMVGLAGGAASAFSGLTGGAFALSSATFGMAGFGFGIGQKTLDRVNNVADRIFMGTFFPGHSAHDHINHNYPAIGPDSKLMQKENCQTPQLQQASTQKQQQEVSASLNESNVRTSVPEFLKDILNQQKSSASRPLAKNESFAARENEYLPSGAGIPGP